MRGACVVAVLLLGLALCLAAAATVASFPLETETIGSDPNYDHQTVTYHSTIEPQSQTDTQVTITPFFSPDHSISTLTSLVQSATTSVDIFTPGFSSWNGCTPFSGCYNCTVEQVLKGEEFPIWQALLNKVHSGVKVRILTNDYGYNLCPGKIGPLGFLKLAGADVRFFTTVTFLHTKYISVDGKKSSVSSVNFSYTSFMLNREAGMVFEGNSEILSYYASVFESDFGKGMVYTPSQTYTPAEMAMIHDTTPIPVVVPDPKTLKCKTQSPLQTVTGTATVTTYVSPDFSLDTLMAAINQTTKSFDLSIYEVSNPILCQALEDLHKAGIAVRVFTSYRIVGNDEWHEAQQCYQNLSDVGLQVVQSEHDCVQYSHQKFWIIDGQTVGMSSGNWAPTDFPPASTFPPYGQADWVKANRDMNVAVTNPDVVSIFQTVFDEDYKQGQDWKPWN